MRQNTMWTVSRRLPRFEKSRNSVKGAVELGSIQASETTLYKKKSYALYERGKPLVWHLKWNVGDHWTTITSITVHATEAKLVDIKCNRLMGSWALIISLSLKCWYNRINSVAVTIVRIWKDEVNTRVHEDYGMQNKYCE